MIAQVGGLRATTKAQLTHGWWCSCNSSRVDVRRSVMAEVLVEFTDPVSDSEGITYTARACGSEMQDGRWQGWIEFLPLAGADPIRSGRETTQPNRADTLYWATGLTHVYLEG